MGLFSKFNKKKKKKGGSTEPKRSESILAPETGSNGAPDPDSPEGNQLQKFEELKPRLYPFLRPANTPPFLRFETAGRAIDIPLPCIPFHAATRIFFVEDTGTSFRVLQKTAVPESVSLLELLNLSIRNLVQNVRFDVRATTFGGYILVGNPNHVTSYILVKNLWKDLAKRLDDNLIIAMPVREALLFIPEKKQEELLPKLATACVGMLKDPQHRTHPLTPLLFHYNRETEQLSTYAVRKPKEGSAPAEAPKAEPHVPESEIPAEPLQEEMPKASDDAPASAPEEKEAPHLYIVPDDNEENQKTEE